MAVFLYKNDRFFRGYTRHNGGRTSRSVFRAPYAEIQSSVSPSVEERGFLGTGSVCKLEEVA
jgi:hypothetical protein